MSKVTNIFKKLFEQNYCASKGLTKSSSYDLSPYSASKSRKFPKRKNQKEEIIRAEEALDKALQERGESNFKSEKRDIGLSKVAGGPGSGVTGENTDVIFFLEKSPLISIGKRKQFMSNSSPVQKNVKVPIKSIKYKGQDKFVPKKLVRIIYNSKDALSKPVDLLLDDKGKYHIMDGHHRALAAILLKKEDLKANVWVMGSGMKKIAIAASVDIGKDFKDAFVKKIKEAPEGEVDKYIIGKGKINKNRVERVDLTAPRDRPEAFQ